jgi:hypothetical protein
MHRMSSRHFLLLAAALCALAGCAPTTMGPMVMRMGPGSATERLVQVGARSGPRLSAPIAGTRPFVSGDDVFLGDDNSFSSQQWGIALDAAMTWPLTERLHLHTGFQGEFFLPLPLPGYGVYAGASYYWGSDVLGVGPAVTVRGATDFGIDSRGGSGTMMGTELSCALLFQPEKDVSLGLVPFFAFNGVRSEGTSSSSVYYGGVLAARLSFGWLENLEISGGFGRAKVGSSGSWNVPIMGVRAGK